LIPVLICCFFDQVLNGCCRTACPASVAGFLLKKNALFLKNRRFIFDRLRRAYRQDG
jgi:hypothetical protein